jgi:acetyltransferase-like isoleucine patch superfamily enzyme/O-antigen/teichoic acid export membrane protein
MIGHRARYVSGAANSWPATRLMSHLRTPLFRNGYLLTLNGFLTSGLGILYWILAARLYSVDSVGLNSAALSAIILISGMAQLSLNGVMVRFVPLAGRWTTLLVVFSYLASQAAALVFSLVFIHGLGLWSPALGFFAASPVAVVACILAVMVWCIFALQDSVLTGLRQAMWIPIENTAFGAMKIVLLVPFALFFQQYGILASWMIPVALSLAPINILIFRYLIPRHKRDTAAIARPLAVKPIATYVAGNYPGSLFFLASTTLLPIVVTNQAGAGANAHFYLPWQICIALQLVAVNMTTSLTVEAVRDEGKLALYCRRVLVQIARVLVPAVLLCWLAAPSILRVFGKDYAGEGTLLLRLLAVSVLPNAAVTLYIAVARVRNRMRGIAIAQGLLSALVVGLSYAFLPLFGVAGVGWAYLTGQTLVAAALITTQLRPLLRGASATQDNSTTHRESTGKVVGWEQTTTTQQNVAEQLSSAAQLPTPTWEHSGKHFMGHIARVLTRELRAGVLRYVVFKGNKVAYLRHLGVRIGKDCDILTSVQHFGTEPWLIELGRRVTITEGVNFLTHDGSNRVFRHLVPESSRWGNRFGPIKVGDNCFIGVNAIIMPGVTIGPNSIVGAGSVVNRDVLPGTVVAGVPAREICTLDEYVARYREKMIPINATDRTGLRQELTRRFWGEAR